MNGHDGQTPTGNAAPAPAPPPGTIRGKTHGIFRSDNLMVGFYIVLFMVLGIVRLTLNERPGPLPSAVAEQLSNRCMPIVHVDTNAVGTVDPFQEEDGKYAANAYFIFKARTDMSVDPVDIDDKDQRKVTVRTTKEKGDFQFQSFAGKAIFRTAEGGTLLLSNLGPGTPRLGPVDGMTYEVALDRDLVHKTVAQNGEPAKERYAIAAGAAGRIPIGTGLAVTVLQPMSLPVWISHRAFTLLPVRATGQPGLSDVSIDLSHPALRPDSPAAIFTACARNSPDGPWIAAGVSQTKMNQAGTAKIQVVLPPEILSAAGSTANTGLMQSVQLAVATSDGKYAAVGSFTAIGRIWAATVGTTLTALLFGPLMYLRGKQLKTVFPAREEERWFSGLFTGPDGDPSLSLFQMFLWTIITVWGFVYVFLVEGNLLILTPEMMQLLGIAGVGSVIARWVVASAGGSTSQAPKATSGKAITHPFWQMLSTNGSFDILKLQLFAFTIVIAMYVVWRIADAAAFPVLDANMLLLMGVSQGIYVTGKFTSVTGLNQARALKIELESMNESLANLQRERNAADEKKIAADKQINEAGAAADAEMKSLQATAAAELASKEQLLATAKSRMAALTLDYDKALRELGLVKQ